MKQLEQLTEKKNILLTSRGNKAIQLALLIAKKKGFNKLFIADQGGWYTYSQYGKKLGFEIIELKTDNGLIDFNSISEGVILFNDMPAYAFLQDNARKKGVFYIGDITGSIGKRLCKADILVCSFGEHKVINLGYGGMIATNFEINYESDFKKDTDELNNKLNGIALRLKKLKEIKEKVIVDLKNFNILEGAGLNVLVKGDEEKIIEYCIKNKLDYKKCPMKIKIKENAISIEIQNSKV